MKKLLTLILGEPGTDRKVAIVFWFLVFLMIAFLFYLAP